MWRVAARFGAAAFARPCIGSVLASGSGWAAPALVRAASFSVPSLANLQQCDRTTRSRHDLRVALGLAAGVDMLAEQSDATECAPKKKQKAAAPAAAKKNKAGPALSAIEAALHLEDGEYNMEKIVADRLVGGKKEYLVKWEGYASGHRYSVCDCTPTMDQHHSTAVTARALCLPALKQL